MAETVNIDGIAIELRASKRAKRLGLRASPRGIVLTKPARVSVRQAERFAQEHASWIRKHHILRPPLKSGMIIGQRHRLNVKPGASNRMVISSGVIDVTLDRSMPADQQAAYVERACIKALRAETKQLVEARLGSWQKKLGLRPNSVRIRNSTTRWGSCSSKGNLNFSLYLAQLPTQEQDYIIVHELAHLAQANHQTEFWKIVETHIAGFKALRASLKRRPLFINPKY